MQIGMNTFYVVSYMVFYSSQCHYVLFFQKLCFYHTHSTALSGFPLSSLLSLPQLPSVLLFFYPPFGCLNFQSVQLHLFFLLCISLVMSFLPWLQLRIFILIQIFLCFRVICQTYHGNLHLEVLITSKFQLLFLLCSLSHCSTRNMDVIFIIT